MPKRTLGLKPLLFLGSDEIRGESVGVVPGLAGAGVTAGVSTTLRSGCEDRSLVGGVCGRLGCLKSVVRLLNWVR